MTRRPRRTTQEETTAAVPPDHNISLGEATAVWAKIAALSFGGPAGQIAVMHRVLVEEKRWIGEHRFLHALNYCMLLPGPEAQQLAIYIGWLLHRTAGGLIAGTLFVLPGFVAILGLSYIYVIFGNIDVVAGLFFGLKAAVLAVVLQAVFRLGGRALRNNAMVAIAAAAFIAIFFLHVPFPFIILTAGMVGYVGGRTGSALFGVGRGHAAGAGGGLDDKNSALGELTPSHAQPNLVWSLKISVVLLVLWLVPVFALLGLFGLDNVFSEITVFFSEMAVVTFGGAYAVLAYVAQQAVQNFNWLRPGEMLDGLGMAETTPGPLIMVVEFVGFMGAFRHPGSLDPLVAATLAATLTTWVTFTPCFLWIFLGAPFIERLRGHRALNGALSAITAAVVGVILNLAIWFGLHTLFGDVHRIRLGWLSLDVPGLQSLDAASLALTVLAALSIFRFRLPVIATIFGSAIIGIVWTVLP
jgi:chromate transporter